MVNKRTRDIMYYYFFLLLLHLQYSAYNTPTHNPSRTRPKSVNLLGSNTIIIIYTIDGHSHTIGATHTFLDRPSQL